MIFCEPQFTADLYITRIAVPHEVSSATIRGCTICLGCSLSGISRSMLPSNVTLSPHLLGIVPCGTHFFTTCTVSFCSSRSCQSPPGRGFFRPSHPSGRFCRQRRLWVQPVNGPTPRPTGKAVSDLYNCSVHFEKCSVPHAKDDVGGLQSGRRRSCAETQLMTKGLPRHVQHLIVRRTSARGDRQTKYHLRRSRC